jgi:hypothetical protein
MTADAASGSSRPKGEPQLWEAALGRGEDCLKANARRYRVKARNPARAALSTIKRENMMMAEALRADLHVAVYASGNTSGNPVAVYSVSGTEKAPRLILRFARLQPPEQPLHMRGGPLDRDALKDNIPAAARFRAEQRLGFRGVRELKTTSHWENELTTYCGTAAVLAAIGFPMTPGVFVVGAVILLVRSLARLIVHEVRLQILRRKIAKDPTLQSVLSTTAVRHMFARTLRIPPTELDTQLSKIVLRGTVIIPDLRANHALSMYVDEDSRVAAGGLRPAQLDSAVPLEHRRISPEDLTHSHNILTVVFRRPKRKRPPHHLRNGAEPAESTPPPSSVYDDTQRVDTSKVGLDDLGAEAKVPAKVDIHDLGRNRNRNRRRQQAEPPEDEEEIVDAEVIEEEDMYRR